MAISNEFDLEYFNIRYEEGIWIYMHGLAPSADVVEYTDFYSVEELGP